MQAGGGVGWGGGGGGVGWGGAGGGVGWGGAGGGEGVEEAVGWRWWSRVAPCQSALELLLLL